MQTNPFIKRPATAVSISVLIVIIGLISMFGMPIEQYPTIAPPTIQVTATYTGASADAVQKSVIMPLEESINGVEDMIYMTSTASNTGAANITIYFKQGTDPDIAAVNVQNRVAKAQGLLPSEVTRIGVSTQKQQTDVVKIAILYSPDSRFDKKFLDNYMDINVIPRLKRINGVADVMFIGDVYSMRIWLKPDVMSQYGLVPNDIMGALGEQNIESPTGSLGENSDNTFQYTMKYKGRLQDVEEFKNIVVRSLPDGNVLYLKDVANVELGWLSYGFETVMDGLPSSPIRVFQLAGANATEINRDITELLDEIEEELPEGMAFVTILDTNDFLFASIKEVVITLVLAILLVVLVVYFFLQDVKSTLIPSISIIVSLTGTFACLYIAGFSINLLTLFALVLAIGTVVDNAIVVVEAVQSKFDDGYTSSYLATRDGLADVSTAIITCTVVFMAVFIPICFMGGTTGAFYTQFGITMAVAVGISLLNSLTLSPALCALWLRPSSGKTNAKNFNNIVRKAYTTSYNALLGRYSHGIRFFLNHKWMTWVATGLSVVLLALLISTTKTGLVPQEDKGIIFLDAAVAPGSTVSQTRRIIAQVDSILLACPEIEHFGRGIGRGITNGAGSSYSSAFARLKHWDDRPGKQHSADSVLARLNASFSQIKDANIFAFQQGMIPGYGQGNSIDLYVQDRTGGEMNDLYDVTINFVNRLNERPEIGRAYCAYNMSFPQYSIDVDAAKCKRAGISPSDILSVINGYCGGIYASNFNKFSKVYRVMIQASPEYRLDENSLNSMFVQSGNQMAPVSEFVTMKKVTGAETLDRFNLFSSIRTSVSVADGYSSGQVQQAIAETAKQYLPMGYAYEFGGIAREEAGNSSWRTLFIYLICVVLIYFILVCLYESFFIPFAVILSIPSGLFGSFLFAKMFGLENNIYLQTGIIMLIGLLAKTAILITEYAATRRKAGLSIFDSAYSAAKIRLRPILMTVMTMVFGMLPLMFATGAGANGNHALGSGVVGGLLFGTLAILFLTPTFFMIFQKLQERFFPKRDYEENDSHNSIQR